MKKWELQGKLKIESGKLKVDQVIDLLLENRGIKSKKEVEDYLNPSIEEITTKNLEINEKDFEKGVKRIQSAINKKEQIIIFGDYDVDGIAGSAILWESLNSMGANVLPYIPHRVDEGYGLSKKGIENVLKKYPETKIILTVDNGIVANEAVDFGNSKGLEIIITDHHTPGKNLPKAHSIIHSTKICGAAVGWFLSQRVLETSEVASKISRTARATPTYLTNDHLGLVALATVTDVMQLSGFNRTFVKIGIKSLQKTSRPGFIELFKLAGINKEEIGVYELGFIIGPRLNAMGRIEHAMDSLRFICTPNLIKARDLANKLHLTNRDRQLLTFDSVTHAKNILKVEKSKKLIFISSKKYEPGVVGLIAGRLTEEFYRPSIIFSEGKEFSKASARSVKGFNIIEFIREFSDFTLDAGGHPMAAGLTVRTKDVNKLKRLMEEKAEEEIDESLLIRKIKIDCELPIKFINFDLFNEIKKLSPFGFGNPEPSFLARNLKVVGMRLVGKDSKHLKLTVGDSELGSKLDGILFGYDKGLNLNIGDFVNVAYVISLNEWNGNKNLELKIRDIVKS